MNPRRNTGHLLGQYLFCDLMCFYNNFHPHHGHYGQTNLQGHLLNLKQSWSPEKFKILFSKNAYSKHFILQQLLAELKDIRLEYSYQVVKSVISTYNPVGEADYQEHELKQSQGLSPEKLKMIFFSNSTCNYINSHHLLAHVKEGSRWIWWFIWMGQMMILAGDVELNPVKVDYWYQQYKFCFSKVYYWISNNKKLNEKKCTSS